MFKTAVSLEETGKMQIVALDKTGTITSGEPKVTDMLPAEGDHGRRAAVSWHMRWSKRVNIRWQEQFWKQAEERGICSCRRSTEFTGSAGKRTDRNAGWQKLLTAET